MLEHGHRTAPAKAVRLAAMLLGVAVALGACSASQVRDTVARTGLAAVRGACHAGGNCGVSCPEGSTLNEPTLACTPAPP